MKISTSIIAISLSATIVFVSGCDSQQKIIWPQLQGPAQSLPMNQLPQQPLPVQPSQPSTANAAQLADIDKEISAISNKIQANTAKYKTLENDFQKKQATYTQTQVDSKVRQLQLLQRDIARDTQDLNFYIQQKQSLISGAKN